jgi:glucosamine-6-phosphate deaminase
MQRNEILQNQNTPELSYFTPEVVIFNAPEEVDEYAALQVVEQIHNKPDSVLTLPTGNTPQGMYKILVGLGKEGTLDMSQVTIFNLDEYYPIDPQHPNSYAAFMRRHLIDQVPVGEWYIPDGQADDSEFEAKRYKQLLDAHQPVALAVLGIGPGTTCHIGFNEGGSDLNSSVRYVPLDPQTKAKNSELFANPETIPDGTLTQGVSDILQAEKILVIAKGQAKAWGINRAIKGPVSSDAPASFLKLHPHVTFVLDKEAAQYLS